MILSPADCRLSDSAGTGIEIENKTFKKPGTGLRLSKTVSRIPLKHIAGQLLNCAKSRKT